MGRVYRKIIGINRETGERREWSGTYQFGVEMKTSAQNVAAALNRNGVCCGWKLYDDPETLRRRIEALEQQLKEIENH